MAGRTSVSSRTNGICVLCASICELIKQILEIHCPGSEAAQARCDELTNMALVIMDKRAGIPFATDLEQPVNEVQE